MIQYTVRFPAHDLHYVDVEARIPVNGVRELELFMPVWTPGSYLVREYSRHLEGLAASEGCAMEKVRKNRWRIFWRDVRDEVIVRYRLYCNDLTVRTNYRDDT